MKITASLPVCILGTMESVAPLHKVNQPSTALRSLSITQYWPFQGKNPPLNDEQASRVRLSARETGLPTPFTAQLFQMSVFSERRLTHMLHSSDKYQNCN